MSNILFLHSSSDFYGSSKVLIYSVEAARIAGAVPHVILSEDGLLADYFKNKNIKTSIIRLAIIRRKYFSPLGLLNRLWFLFLATFKIARYCHKNKIDLIYSNTTGVLVGCLVAFILRKKHIFHIHEIIEKPRILGKFISFLINISSHKVIIISKAVADNWLSNGLKPHLIEIVYNGQAEMGDYTSALDLKHDLNLAQDTLLIAMIGRINLWKGQEYFLRMAAQVLSQTNQKIHFVYCGDVYPGYEFLYQQLASLTAELAIENHVTYLGYRTDIVDILANTDIFVLPSITPEPFGMVIIEAMERGIPVVATAHGGPLEIVEDQVSGYFIPFDNVLLAADKLLKLIEDSDLRKQFGRNGRQRYLTMFSMHQYQKSIQHILQSS
jgi:glycosyltransferase involved in cell wall biosynthesis